MGRISADIKGHDSTQHQLFQALKTSRLAHALLFSGPSGLGKRQMAWALAQSLLCEKEHPPCGNCPSCRAVLKRQSESVLCVTHETLQIRLQDVEGIPPFLSLQSFSKAKIVLIDEAEKLGLQAANFLLKILEEPPPKSFFFLISSKASRLPITIRSRVQNLRFQPLSEEVIRELSPPETKPWMIRGSRGRLDLLEDLGSQSEVRAQAFDLWNELFEKSFSPLALDFPARLKTRGEALDLCRFCQQILRDARFLQIASEDQLIHGDKKKEIERISRFPSGLLNLWIQYVLQMEADLQANVNYVLCFEKFVVSMKKSLSSFKKYQKDFVGPEVSK